MGSNILDHRADLIQSVQISTRNKRAEANVLR